MSIPDHRGAISDVRRVSREGSGRFVVLVANSKGGCGKTTLSTGLASQYAGIANQQGLGVTLIDMDPQQSASLWHQSRQKQPQPPPAIQLLKLPVDEQFSSSLLQQTLNTAHEIIIIDSPAGVDRRTLDSLMAVSRVVLVPVLPSPIDIRATTRFLQMLMLAPSYQRRPRRLAVVANRARERTRNYQSLQQFLSSLKIPFLTTLRDTQLYVQAAGDGLGIIDYPQASAQDITAWRTLIEWLEIQRQLTRHLPMF